MNWIERVLGGTRGQLLAMLRRSKRSVNELAVSLGISDNAVRTHVAAMQRDGMVEPAGIERGTGGKPAQLYQITPEAEEMYPKAYALVLNELLRLLREREGREAVVGLLREVGARAAAEAGAAGSAGARVEAAADALRRLGGDVEVEREGGGWLIRGFGCPLSAVVDSHEEACALAESLVAAITREEVTECCERAGRPRCAFRVEARPAGAGTAP